MKKTIILGLIVGLILFFAFIEIFSWNKIYPGVKVANIHLGGLTITQAKTRLEKVIEDFSDQKITLSYNDREWKASPEELGINFDIGQTLNKSFRVDKFRINPLLLYKKSKTLLFGYNFSLVVKIDQDLFNQFIEENLASSELPAKDAGLKILELDTDYTIRLIPSEEGLKINRTLFELELKEHIRWLGKDPVKIRFVKDWPQVKNSEIANARMKAYQIIDSKVSLEYESQSPASYGTGQKWNIPQEEVASWIEFINIEALLTPSQHLYTPALRSVVKAPLKASTDALTVSLNQDKIKNFLTPLAPEINSEPINAELKITNGKVATFALSQNGKRLEVEESAKQISRTVLASVLSRTVLDIKLMVTTLEPEVTTESIDNLGITALIGKGESNYAGSPKNRVHNIKLGSAKFNGALIKPGEEFSFNKVLGEVGPTQGYLPELVIKRDKTTPEFGGGICQVSTTMFRAAIFSGLPIIERFPHAFPVAYYSPQGMDATIYPPHPDLRFKNDTPGHILIQRKISGTKITFEFFGTDDGRETKIKGPYITEKKEDGSMKTVFYREFYQDEELVKKETFRSSYASPAKYPIE